MAVGVCLGEGLSSTPTLVLRAGTGCGMVRRLHGQ